MKRLRFAETAELRLEEIFDWSIENFGSGSAESYLTMLITTCEKIANGTAQTQNCSVLMREDLDTNMRFARAGKHFIVFEEIDDTIAVIDVVHGSTNVATHLKNLNARKG